MNVILQKMRLEHFIPGELITVAFSDRNLRTVLSRLDSNPNQSSCRIYNDTDKGITLYLQAIREGAMGAILQQNELTVVMPRETITKMLGDMAIEKQVRVGAEIEMGRLQVDGEPDNVHYARKLAGTLPPDSLRMSPQV